MFYTVFLVKMFHSLCYYHRKIFQLLIEFWLIVEIFQSCRIIFIDQGNLVQRLCWYFQQVLYGVFIKREITLAYEKYMQSKEGQLFWNETLSNYLCQHEQSFVDICLFVKGEGCHLNKAVYKMLVMMITFPNLSIKWR